MFKKFLEYGIGNIFVLVVSLISTPIITKLISPDEFGKSSLFITLSNITSLVVLAGMDQILMRFYYDKEYNRYALLKKILKSIIFTSTIFIIIITIFSSNVSRYILGYKSNTLIFILIANVLSLVFMRVGFCSIRVQQRGKIYSMIQIFGKLIYILGITIFYYIYRDSYLTLVLTLLISNIGITILLTYIDRDYLKNSLKYNIQQDDDYFKEKIRFGIPFIFSSIFIWIFKSCDTVIIKLYEGYSNVGIYSISFSLIGVINIIQSTFMNFWTPIANQSYETNPGNKNFFIDMNKIVSYIMLSICSIFILLKDFIYIILGRDYYESVYLLPFLIFIPLMSTISETTVQGINFMKKTKYHIYISVICSIVNIIGNLILVKYIGLKGAAISTGLSYILYFYLRTLFSNKEYEVKYSLKELYICLIPMFIFSLYSTYNSLNLMTIMMFIFSNVIFYLQFRDTARKLIKKVKGG